MKRDLEHNIGNYSEALEKMRMAKPKKDLIDWLVDHYHTRRVPFIIVGSIAGLVWCAGCLWLWILFIKFAVKF